jgi:hypothetical protein
MNKKWLPQQQSMIVSDEIYNFANGGANKILELTVIARFNGFDFSNNWYISTNVNFSDYPISEQFNNLCGVIIPKNSPIWAYVNSTENQVGDLKMSQFIVVKNPINVDMETKPYTEKAIFFTKDIKEIYHYQEENSNSTIEFNDNSLLIIENTLEDIINQLKGQ